MTVLLDTHAFLWWVLGDDRLSGSARAVIESRTDVVHVSAISALEIGIKVRLLKLPQAQVLAHRFESEVAQQGFKAIPVTASHARCAGLLKGLHRDPFDRVIAAQALLEGLTLVSNDVALDTFEIARLW